MQETSDGCEGETTSVKSLRGMNRAFGRASLSHKSELNAPSSSNAAFYYLSRKDEQYCGLDFS